MGLEFTVPATSKSTAVRQTANSLRTMSLERKDGDLIGSEEEIVEALKVSRPTVRQAASLLAQEQLLTVKRGPGGGYFASRPDTSAVAHMAAIFLQTRDVRLEEILRAVGPIRVEISRLAALNANAVSKEQLAEFLEREKERDTQESSYRAFLKDERDFAEIIGNMSNNVVLYLFLEILYELTSMISRDEDVYRNHPERIQEYRRARNQMAESILHGDEEMATVTTRRCTKLVMEWMLADLQRRSLRPLLERAVGEGDRLRTLKK